MLEEQAKKDADKKAKDVEKARKEQENKDKEVKKKAEEERKRIEKKKQKEMEEREKKTKEAKRIIEAIAQEEREKLPWGAGGKKPSLKETLFGKEKKPELRKKPVPETATVEAPIVPKPVSRWDVRKTKEKSD